MEIQQSVELFFLLVAVHFLCDFSLQNDFIAQAKNHKTTLGSEYWYWVLPAHGFIHGLGVYLVTGSVIYGLIEVVAHSLIDYSKCDGHLDFNADQFLHLFFKFMYVLMIGQGVLIFS